MNIKVKGLAPRELGIIYLLASIVFGYIWITMTQGAIDLSYTVPDPLFRVVGPAFQILGLLVVLGMIVSSIRIILGKPLLSVELNKSKGRKKK